MEDTAKAEKPVAESRLPFDQEVAKIMQEACQRVMQTVPEMSGLLIAYQWGPNVTAPTDGIWVRRGEQGDAERVQEHHIDSVLGMQIPWMTMGNYLQNMSQRTTALIRRAWLGEVQELHQENQTLKDQLEANKADGNDGATLEKAGHHDST